MPTHYRIPDVSLFPDKARDAAQAAADAAERFHAADAATRTARGKLKTAETEYPAKVRTAALDGSTPPADRRAALRAELDRAEELRTAAKRAADQRWYELEQVMRAVTSADLEHLTPDAHEAAADYQRALDQAEQARARMHLSMSTRTWMAWLGSPLPRGQGPIDRRTLPDWRPRTGPDDVDYIDGRGTRRNGTVTAALAVLRADADTPARTDREQAERADREHRNRAAATANRAAAAGADAPTSGIVQRPSH